MPNFNTLGAPQWRLCAGALLVLSLAACGGGGGGDSKNADASANSTVSSAKLNTERTGEKISLSGVVAKGLTGDADVAVLAVKADGSVDDSSTLATGSTSASGVYSTGSFTTPAIYVVQVSARACANTTTGTGCSYHQDEATGKKQYLPTGFKMRAMVAITPLDNKVNVTAFSEIAFEAAVKAGGLTATNTDKALNMINSLVGVADLNAVVPTSLTDTTASPGQVRLAALLAGASGMANSASALSKIGCASVTAGTPEATQCVVGKLAGNATVSNYVGETPAITAELNTQMEAAVAGNPDTAALVATTSKKLTDATQTVPASTGATGVSGYDKVKAFFADLTSTVQTLFDSNSGSGHALLDQAHTFENAVRNVDFQSQTFVGSGTALELAVELWNAFDHGSQHPSSQKWREINSSQSDLPTGYGCQLKKADDSDVAAADSPTVVDHVQCYADFTYQIDYTRPTGTYPVISYPVKNAFHWFVVSKTGTSGTYAYVSEAAVDDRIVTINYQTHNSTDTLIDTTQAQLDVHGDPRLFSGAIAATLDSGSRLQSLHIKGEVPDGFANNSALLHAAAGTGNAAKSALDITVSITNAVYSGTGPSASMPSGTLNFSGSQIAYAANGSTEESSTVLGTGSFLTVLNEQGTTGKLLLTMTTPTAKLVGTLEATSQTNDGLAGTFTGQLYNLGASTTVPFISGKITADLDNRQYVSTQPWSATNYQSLQGTLDVFVTAPSHPKLRLIMGTSLKQTAQEVRFGLGSADTASGNYIIYKADGSTLRDVTFSLTSPNADGKFVATVADGTNGIAFTFRDHVDTSDVYVDAVRAGFIDLDKSILYLSSGEFQTLDFGTVKY